MEGLNSDLNLNAGASPRAMPQIGEWGPVGVPSTRAKRRQRWWVILAAVGVLFVVCVLGWRAWLLLY